MKIGGPSDRSDGVSTRKLSNEKVYTERVDCSPTYCLLLEIKSNFKYAKIIKSLLLKYDMKELNNYMMCFSNNVQIKYNLLENFAFKNL